MRTNCNKEDIYGTRKVMHTGTTLQQIWFKSCQFKEERQKPGREASRAWRLTQFPLQARIIILTFKQE